MPHTSRGQTEASVRQALGMTTSDPTWWGVAPKALEEGLRSVQRELVSTDLWGVCEA